LEGITDSQFPPCVKKICEGVSDGKKRGLFALINLFRSIGMDKDEFEKRIYGWNEKNENPLKKGYIHSQLLWCYKKKPIMPPNCKEFYQGIGVCEPDNFCKFVKNPVNYIIKKNFKQTNSKKKSSTKIFKKKD
jgi:DNA primase large subunit